MACKNLCTEVVAHLLQKKSEQFRKECQILHLKRLLKNALKYEEEPLSKNNEGKTAQEVLPANENSSFEKRKAIMSLFQDYSNLIGMVLLVGLSSSFSILIALSNKMDCTLRHALFVYGPSCLLQ